MLFYSGIVEMLLMTSVFPDQNLLPYSVDQQRLKFFLHAGVGEAIESEPLLKGSNLLVKMNCGNKRFVDSMLENGIPHHNAICYGDITEELREFAKFMRIPCVIYS